MNGLARTQPRPHEAAAYIEQTTAELRDLASRANMPFLAYLIDMARLEAASRVGAPASPPPIA